MRVFPYNTSKVETQPVVGLGLRDHVSDRPKTPKSAARQRTHLFNPRHPKPVKTAVKAFSTHI